MLSVLFKIKKAMTKSTRLSVSHM